MRPMADEQWVLADAHPTNGWADTPDVNGLTLQDLVDWAKHHGHSLTDVSLEYGGCGSHAIELWVRTKADSRG